MNDMTQRVERDIFVIGDALCHILGNTCRIARSATSYAWNVVGPGAYAARQCFRDQSHELHASVELIGDHIRALGGCAAFDYTDEVVALNPPANGVILDLPRMIANLTDAHRQACQSIKAAIDVARESDDEATVVLLAERLAAHRRHGAETDMLQP